MKHRILAALLSAAMVLQMVAPLAAPKVAAAQTPSVTTTGTVTPSTPAAPAAPAESAALSAQAPAKVAPAPAASVTPQSQTNGSDSLAFKVADNSGVWQDVDSIGNALTWNVTTVTRQIQVIPSFPTGTAQARKVEIDIPAGYRILEMSGPTSFTAPNGIRKLAFSSDDNSKVQSCTLTASDGTIWPKAIPMGPIPSAANYYSTLVSSQTLKDGKITYFFNNNCDNIVLTVTLGLERTIMPHNATSCVLAPLTATLTGTSTLNDTLNTTVTGLIVPAIGGAQATNVYGGSRTVGGVVDSGNAAAGTVPEFVTGYNYSCYDSTMTYSDGHFVESATFTVSYPKGVSLTGFGEKIISGYMASTSSTWGNKVPSSAFTAGMYSVPSGNGVGHLTVAVTGDASTGGTVTFAYTNTYVNHDGNGGSFWCFWTADVNQNGSPIQWNGTVSFPATYTETGGVLANDSQTRATVNTTVNIKIIPNQAFNVKATGTTRTFRDLNGAYNQTYPYDQLLGQFKIYNAAPNDLTTPLRYVFTFDDSLEVRGVALPGIAGNNFSYVVATAVDSATGATRTITLPGPFTVTNLTSQGPGYTFDSVLLGLNPTEYLTTFQVDQSGLAAIGMTQDYTYSSTSYYGRWQNGVTGDATVQIFDLSDPGVSDSAPKATATSHTTIGWTSAGVGSAGLSYAKNGITNATGSFNPTDKISFTAPLSTGAGVVGVGNSNDITDPTVYIALPEGIVLDLSSVQGMSAMGNAGYNNYVNLKLISTSSYTDGNGVTWNVYGFTSVNPMDMVALANRYFSSALQFTGYNTIVVKFNATVESSCSTYSNLAAADIVRWDLGQTAVMTASGNFIVADTNNVTGKGASYNLAGAITSVGLNIVQQPGLNVSLGIRVYNGASNTLPFYSYSGLAATIASVSADTPAELKIGYQNTSATAYKAGSEIYLPIPKAGQAYDHYFNNTEISDPINIENNKTPAWSAYLIDPGAGNDAVSMPGFTTYYLVDNVYTTTPIPSGGQPNDWVPITPTTAWKTAASMTSSDWANVTMIKFVANADIPSGASGTTTFTVNVDHNAQLGQVDYWRSYQKGWTNTTGAGTWTYGEVVAATPAKAGITGMVFYDWAPIDGKKAIMGEGFNNSTPTVKALLTEANNSITPMNLTMNADGSFKTLNPDGTQYFLKAGTYTVTFTNTNPTKYFFTNVTSAIHSDGLQWNMDVKQANIAVNQATATYTFTVDSTSSSSTEYLGIGLRDAVYTITYDLNTTDPTAAKGAAGVASEADVVYGTKITDAASYATNTASTGVPTRTGYTFGGWYLDSGCTTAIGATTVTGNTTVYANWTINKHTVTYAYTGTAPLGAPTKPGDVPNVDYNSSQTVSTDPAPATWPAGYTFSGWSTTSAGVTISGGSFTMPDNDVAFTGSWTAIPYAITYTLNGGTNAAGNPTGYTAADTFPILIGDPIRTGYVFAGWTVDYVNPALTDITAVTKPYSVPVGTTGDISLTATWTPSTTTAYHVEHYWVDSTGAVSLHETESLTATTAATVTATAKDYSALGYAYSAGYPSEVATGTIAADGSLVLKLYYVQDVFTASVRYHKFTAAGEVIDTVPVAGSFHLGDVIDPAALLDTCKPAGFAHGVPVGTWTVTGDGMVFDVYYPDTAPVIHVTRPVLYVRQPATLTLADILRLAGVSVTDAEESIPLSALQATGYAGIKWSVVNYPGGVGYQIRLNVSDTPGLAAPYETISIFVEKADTPIIPTPGPVPPPPGKKWGRDPQGHLVLYIPTLALPQTGDALVAAPLAFALAGLGALALVSLRRRRTS